jgi:hypothetical protein
MKNEKQKSEDSWCPGAFVFSQKISKMSRKSAQNRSFVRVTLCLATGNAMRDFAIRVS